ncbi:MAG TPA: DUF6599 family protein [Humidesulfovibrio sp.]|uniref:DUF6599 family protein n=1 Tax=Humidesulfovibrio sp. TaxID=2910988 RepID=UPI002BFCCE0E|nr:DUF6599 family protein [Humidesulfovibrio sp.]HWR04827.1 DUF6599 family protein [Humidesulfovibrio sp.]
MARREQSVSRAERLASLAVLAVLCGLAAWMLSGRTRLNPAVEVALRAPALKAQAGQSAAGAASSEAAPAESSADPNVPVGAKPATLAGLLPEDAPGLKPLAKAEAFTPATLSDKIDGKAELYLAAGFAGMACRSYQAGTARIDVYIYRMKTQDAAFAAFSGQRRPGAAQSGLAKNGYLTENALFLTHGADYIEVIADRAGAKPALEALAKAVLAGLGGGAGEEGKPGKGAQPGAGEIQPGDLFPKAGLKADSLRLTVADTFGFQGFANVYTAEYDQSAGGGTAFIARRPDAAEAKKTAQAYQRFLTDNGYAVQTPGGSPAGSVVLVMEGSVEILLVRGNILAGVHDAPDLASALKLANPLDAALKARGLDK